MTVTRERFNQGMTYDQFKASMTQTGEQLDRNERELVLSTDDLAPFASLPQPFDVLVLVTETCPDVITNVPILGRIAKQTAKLNVRVFMRDDNKDLMAQFMNGPYESVPVFAFFDRAFALRSVFVERPRSVTELRERKAREFHDEHPELGPYGASAGELKEDARHRLRQVTNQIRSETASFYVRETTRELREIAEELGRGVNDGLPRWRGNLAAVPA